MTSSLVYDENDEALWDPVSKPLDEDLNEAGEEVMSQMIEKQRELINSLDLSKWLYIEVLGNLTY